MLRTAFPTARADRLPRVVEVNGEEVTLRLMSPADATALHAFFQEIAEESPRDLLFLRRDVTSGAEIDSWALEIASGEMITVLAIADGEVLGEASLHRNTVPWTRHVGNVRVVIHPRQRGRGLAKLLLAEACAVAMAGGIERLTAEMTAEQRGARGLFGSLGFLQEGHYRNFARDLEGNLHDLVVMTAGRPEVEKLIAAIC